jgi:anti-sigma B factor antagonist
VTTQALRVEERARDGVLWILARGEIDLFTCPPLREALQRAALSGEKDVALDLSGVSFMDSTGIALMINAQRRLRRRGHRFHVVCDQGPVLRTLAITGIVDNFSLFPSQQALADGPRPG